MPRNEEGEYELLLGNRQLLSVFVIVVVLLGIFFAMGYVTGKNSGGALVAGAKAPDANGAAAGVPASDVTPSPKASAARGDVPVPQSSDPASETTAAPAPSQTAPVQTAPVQAAPPKPVAREVSTDAAADPAVPAAGQTFLQITAVARHDAEMMSDTLNKRGFHARIAPSPKGLFRVLVGPTRSAAELARLRTSLEEAGFRNPIVRKY